MKKYQLSEATRVFRYTRHGEPCTVTLRQLIALRDFAQRRNAGRLGGERGKPQPAGHLLGL